MRYGLMRRAKDDASNVNSVRACSRDIRAYSRNDKLTTEDFEILVIAEK